jgi:hypothetical protein
MPRGLFVPAISSGQIEVRSYRGLGDYQAAVGGWIEAVDLPLLGITMYVNENGLGEGLEFNARASFLWWLQRPSRGNLHRLLGDIAIVGFPDERGYDSDVPDATMEFMTRPKPHVVVMQVEGQWFRGRNVNRDYWEAALWAVVKRSRDGAIEEVDVVPVEVAERYPPRPIEDLWI